MTLIDKAEALAKCKAIAEEARTYGMPQMAMGAFACMEAVDALAPTDAVRCDECDCDDGNCTWIKMHIEPDAPTDAAHVNETPKSEHDGADVLTAAQAREAAARLLLDMLYMQNGAHEGVSKEDAQKMWDAASTRDGYAAVDAFLRSIIGEPRT